MKWGESCWREMNRISSVYAGRERGLPMFTRLWATPHQVICKPQVAGSIPVASSIPRFPTVQMPIDAVLAGGPNMPLWPVILGEPQLLGFLRIFFFFNNPPKPFNILLFGSRVAGLALWRNRKGMKGYTRTINTAWISRASHRRVLDFGVLCVFLNERGSGNV